MITFLCKVLYIIKIRKILPDTAYYNNILTSFCKKFQKEVNI